MSLVDRFICRREGHKPSVVIDTGKEFVTSFVAPCLRCGKQIEWKSSGTPLAASSTGTAAEEGT